MSAKAEKSKYIISEYAKILIHNSAGVEVVAPERFWKFVANTANESAMTIFLKNPNRILMVPMNTLLAVNLALYNSLLKFWNLLNGPAAIVGKNITKATKSINL